MRLKEVILHIPQNVLRHLCQGVGPGGGQLCAAPEAPQGPMAGRRAL